MYEAEDCRKKMLADRPSGEQAFSALLARVGEDGMVYFKRAEAYEALGESVLSHADFKRAETLLLMPEWKKRAREGMTRTTPRSATMDSTAASDRGLVTLAELHPRIQPLARKLIEELCKFSDRVSETPTRTYLAVKYGKSLVCALYPGPAGIFLGHWDPPAGGRAARWLKPLIGAASTVQSIEPVLAKLRLRVELLEGKQGLTEEGTGPVPSQRIPRSIQGGSAEEGGAWFYKIGEMIGEGGMGMVYRGHGAIGSIELVAVKFLGTKATSREHLLRFRREVRLHATRLDHPNIISLLGSQLDGGWPYFVMEYAHEGSLRERLQRGPIEPAEGFAIFESICAGVGHAHSQGVVHRDLKPENILQVNAGVWKVSDFGLCMEMARQTTTLTQTNLGLGTAIYCSPEQLRNAKDVDHRTDVYSLAVVLFELLTGNFPPVRLSEVPEPYRGTIDKATERDPSRRYQSVDEFLKAVQDART
jgi:hypothetical protein